MGFLVRFLEDYRIVTGVCAGILDSLLDRDEGSSVFSCTQDFPVFNFFLHIFVYSCEGIECLDIYGVRGQLGETVHSYSVGPQELISGCQA